MENQHRKISNYGELTQAEIDLMNEIKQKETELNALCSKLGGEALKRAAHHQFGLGRMQDGWPARLDAEAEAHRWVCIGRDHIQIGLMALTRAVARPFVE